MRGNPQIITNLNIIEDFLPEAVQLSNRAFYDNTRMTKETFLKLLHVLKHEFPTRIRYHADILGATVMWLMFGDSALWGLIDPEFSNCLGAIDGTYINVRCAEEDKDRYVQL